MADLAREWLGTDIAKRVSASSFDQYRADVERIVCRVCGQVPVSQFDAAAQQRAVDAMAEIRRWDRPHGPHVGYATRRVRRATSVLKRIAAYGALMGYMPALPRHTLAARCSDWRSHSRLRLLQPAEAAVLYQALCDVARHPRRALACGWHARSAAEAADARRYALGCLLGLACGLRVGEACAVRREDVSEGRVSVAATVSYAKGAGGEAYRTEVGAAKTRCSERSVPIPAEVAALIEEAAPRRGFIVPGGDTRAQPASTRAVNIWLRRLMGALGIGAGLTFHALRHTYATKLLAAGCDIKTISRLLGHTDVSTTANIYVHPDDESLTEAVARLEWR
jgi:integrase